MNTSKSPLEKFRTVAAAITFVAIFFAIVFAVVAAVNYAQAQSDYSYYSRYSSYTYSDSSSSDYLISYRSHQSTASIFLIFSFLSGVISMFSIFARIGASLHFSSMRTVLSSLFLVPVELEKMDGSIDLPVGSEVTLKKSEDSLIASAASGVPVGMLNGDVAKRTNKAIRGKSARAFIVSYHNDCPVIRIYLK